MSYSHIRLIRMSLRRIRAVNIGFGDRKLRRRDVEHLCDFFGLLSANIDAVLFRYDFLLRVIPLLRDYLLRYLDGIIARDETWLDEGEDLHLPGLR